MKKSEVLLGFEVKTGKQINIKPSHLIVTGLTQKAGKTTTLESLIKRSKKRAIVFRTKIGEKSFLSGTIIPPYFKDRCLIEGTKIFTKDGVKPIENLNIGDEVLDRYGEFVKVTNLFKNILQGRLINIKPLGLPLITMTENHPILVVDRISRHWKKGKGNYDFSKPYWIIANKLSKKHCLLAPRINKINQKTIHLSKYLKDKKLTGLKTKLEIILNEEFLWLLGFYLADGNSWSSDNGGYVRFYCGLKEDEKAEKVFFILKKEGFKPRKRVTKNMIEVSCSSKIFARFLKDNFNVGAFNKKIPSFVYELDGVIIKEFIKGWFDGDGCLSKSNGRDRFAGISISDNIAYGLTILGAKIGIPIMISKSKAPKNSFRNSKERWVIEVSGDYAKDLGFSDLRVRKKERRAIKVDINYLYYPIRNIEQNNQREEFVYNFETETHSYSTPVIHHNSDWQFIQGLVEATMKEKLKGWDRAAIIRLSKETGGNSLLDFKKKTDEKLLNPKLRGFERDILTNLQAYLEIVLPKLQSINLSNELELVDGLNIIDLERFARDIEVQSLIIRSVLEEVLYKFKDVIIVMPEAWKFIPQGRGNPCKLIVEDFIRQGATNGNFIWIDSQDMANVDKNPLKQITEWILGYQSEINEVKHTLEQIPLPKSQKPKAEDIMSLGTGIFYFATREATIKLYVQPFWLDDDRAKKIALGKLKIEDLDAPETITPFKIAIKKESITEPPTIDFSETTRRFQKELNEMSNDFFNKIGEIQEQINKVYTEIYKLKTGQKPIEIDEDIIVRKIIQKIPLTQSNSNINKEEIIAEILSKIPRQSGSATYEIAPLEAIKKKFLNDAKNKVISDIQVLSQDEKKALQYMESKESDVTSSEIVLKCLLLKAGGSSSTKVSNIFKSLLTAEVVEKTAGGRYRRGLKKRLQFLLSDHNATEKEIDDVYSHILANLLEK